MSKDVNIIFATQSRSGSQFLIDITNAALPKEMLYPQSRLNGCRVDTMRDKDHQHDLQSILKLNKPIDKYFTDNDIRAIKLEEPSNDNTGIKIANVCTNAKWLISVRKIEDIISSHYNIKSWGYPEDKVLKLWVSNLEFYENLIKQRKPLFAIDVSNPKNNSVDKFCKFLGVDVNPQVKDKFENWEVVNPLMRQKQLHNEKITARQTPPNISSLRIRNNWIYEVEKRYKNILNRQ